MATKKPAQKVVPVQIKAYSFSEVVQQAEEKRKAYLASIVHLSPEEQQKKIEADNKLLDDAYAEYIKAGGARLTRISF
jgi:hypothetical protein